MSHPRIAYTSERETVVAYMHNGVIDAGSSGTGLANNIPSVFFVAEVIESQWFLSFGDEIDYFRAVLELQNREYWPENFLLHYRRVRFYIVQKRRLDVSFITIILAPGHDIAVLHIFCHTFEGPVIDHPDVVWTLLDISAVQAPYLPFEGFNELPFYVFVQE